MFKIFLMICLYLLNFQDCLISQCLSNWKNNNLSLIGTSFNSAATNNDNISFVVGNNGIIIKSSDEFKNIIYIKVNNEFKNTALNDIKFLNNQVGIIVGDCGLILKSENKGNSWFKINTNITENILSVDFDNNFLIIVGQDGIIYYSNDLGDNWTKASNPDKFDLRKVKILDETNIIAVGDKGLVYRSQNMGKDWTKRFKATDGRILLDIDVFNDRIVACGNLGNIIVSYDKGTKWELLNKDQEPLDWFGDRATIIGIKFLDENNLIAFGNFDGIYYSTNSGSDWNIYDNSDTLRMVDLKKIIKQGNKLFGFGGIPQLKSSTIVSSNDNGKNWEFLVIESNIGDLERSTLNTITENFNCIDVNESGITVIGSSLGNIYYKDAFDDKSKIINLLNINSSIRDIAIINNSNVLALSSDSGKCYMGSAFGSKIEEIKPLGYTSKYLRNEQVLYNFPNTFLSMSYYPLELDFPESILLTSSNNGADWTKLDLKINGSYYIKNIIKYGERNIVHLILINDPLFSSNESKLFEILSTQTTNEIEWKLENDDNKFINNIYFTNKNIGFILVKKLDNYKLYFTNDGGKQWEVKNKNLEISIPFEYFKITYLDNENLIFNVLGDYFSQIYYSSDGGVTWILESINQNIPYIDLINDCVAFTNADKNNYIIVGDNKTMFQKTFNINNTSIVDMLNTHNSFIFPNPSSDKISVDLGEVNGIVGVADLSIYDILGNEIITIPNYTNKTEIDISNLSIGTYTIQIQTPTGSVSQRLLVNR